MRGKIGFRDNAWSDYRDGKNRSFERSKPGGRNHVVAGIAAHLAAFEGKRSRVAKLRTAAANFHNIGIAGQPDSQEQRRVCRDAGRERRRGQAIAHAGDAAA